VRLNSKNAFNRDNFETFLVSSLLPNNEIDLTSVNVDFDLFEKKEQKEIGSRVSYYVFDYVSLINK
jgi:hypothetical protein